MLILACVTLVCCLLIIGGINKPHVSPLRLTLEAKYPISAAYNEHGCAVLDNQDKRILVLTPDMKLKTIIDASLSGSPIDRFSFVTMYGDKIYAIGSCCFNKGLYVSSEVVVEYDLKGRVTRTVFSKEYADYELINNPRFAHITVFNDRMYLVTKEGCEISLLSIDGTAKKLGTWTLPEPVYSAAYLPESGECMVTGLSQNGYYIDCNTNTVTQESDADHAKEILEWFGIEEDEASCEALENCYWIPSTVINSDGIAEYHSLVDPEGNAVTVLSNDTNAQYELSKIPYSAMFLLKNLSFWLALVIVGAEVAAVIVWLLFKKLTVGAKIVIAVIGAVVLTSLFYTMQMTKASEAAYSDILVSQTKQMSFILSNDYGDYFKSVCEKGISDYCGDPDNQKDISKLRAVLKTLCDANGADMSCFVCCYLSDGEQLWLLTESTGTSLTGEPVFLSEEAKDSLAKSAHEVIASESFEDEFVYDYDGLYSSDGSPLGILCVSGLRGSLNYMQSQTAVELSVTLLVLIVGIYMAISVVRFFSTDLRRRSLRDRSDTFGRSMDLMQLYSFIGSILFGLDSVIVVYVARSLCAGADGASYAMLVAIPVAAQSLGQAMGRPMAVPLSRRFGDRAAAVFGSAMTVIAMLICFMAVKLNSIYLYSAGKFFVGVFIPGMMYVLIDALPYHSNDEGSRKSAINSMVEGGMAASVLSALAGGYISQYLSYGAIYLLGVLIAVAFLVISALIFPKNGFSAKSSATKTPMLKTWTVFLKGPILIYLLLYVLPGVLVDGYKAYLFPMFSAGAGISVLLLSKLTVFVQAFTYMLKGSLRKLSEKSDPDTIMIAPMLIVCFGFLCFYISPNIYWAIVMLFVYEIMSVLTMASSRLYLVKRVESYNIDLKRVLPHFYSVQSAINAVQSPVLSAVVPLGINFAGSVVGAVCGAMYTVFALYRRRDRKKKS